MGNCFLFRKQGVNCGIPVEIEKIFTYVKIKSAETLQLDKVVSLIFPVHFL